MFNRYKDYTSPNFANFPTKSYYWNLFLPIFNNFFVQYCLDKPVFNNVSRLNHSSLMNITVTNKIKHFPRVFPLGP